MKTLVPNMLTLSRLLLAPVVAWCMWKGFSIPFEAQFGPNATQASFGEIEAAKALGEHYQWGAAILFVIAALTDLFDGMAARALDADSKFGRILDPIADKALVGLPLAVLSILSGYSGVAGAGSDLTWSAADMNPWIVIPTIIIIGRDLVITILRLFAEDGEGARVLQLSKWKTAIELIAVALPIFIALPYFATSPQLHTLWLYLLGFAAFLSLLTGLIYIFSPSSKDDDQEPVEVNA